MYTSSKELFERAKQSIPGGVNSPVRAFKSVGGTPIFMKSAKGAYLYDEDGNSYIDYINSWGPMIMGHAYQPVIDAVQQQLQHSLSYGAPTRLEIEMAELVKRMVPNIELIRMVNSGTEACMSALRLARGYTGRNKFIKFDGCYHGHADSFLVNAGSGLATLNIQEVPGVTAATAQDTLTAAYNDLSQVEELVGKHKNEIAAIIIEPVAGNMGCIPATQSFIDGLRRICDEEKIVLIFDEVMSGFRLGAAGAQAYYGVDADLVTYGKIIGGGLPVGAYGGKKAIMECIAPAGKIYQAGTLSGNPLAMQAGMAMLNALSNDAAIYQRLEESSSALASGLSSVFLTAGIPVQINRVGSMLSVHFTKDAVIDYDSAKAADIKMFTDYFHHCLQNGVYLPPSAFESWFISDSITNREIEKTIAVTQSFVNGL